MTLEESILFYEEQAKKCNNKVNQIILGAERCEQDKREYTQLAEWLRELQERRKQPEIIHCKDCKYSAKRKFLWCDRTWTRIRTMSNCFCSWAERRTDG